MKDTIVFCLETDNEESYGEISNFIYKRESRIDITEEEIQRISFKYYLKNEIDLSNVWARTIYEDMEQFKKIKESHKILNITERFEIIYCIFVDKNADIINLYNLYLIKQHYTDLNIIVLFPNCDDKCYFTVSQFLYSVAINDKKFYNDCFFAYNGKIQRSQIQNISFSRYFTPLQIIDKENIKRLFQSCKDLLRTEYFHTLMSKEKMDMKVYNDLLEGVIKILFDNKQISKIIGDKYIQVFQKMDVFAFVLLCYVIHRETENITLSVLEKYAFQMQQYSNAIRQLAENIVFHSKTGCGVIAIRVHDKKTSYINDTYKITSSSGSFLEIIISDFCRDNTSGNIADNFVSNLQDVEMKAIFKGLQPTAFFSHDQEKAWKEFYNNADNIGKHFGLKIFQSVVSTFHGIFGAESHCGYINMPGDSFLSYTGSENKACMPGTRYHIVFPLENIQTVVKKQDLSLDSGINFGTRINQYLSYTTGEMELLINFEIPQTQQQKNEQIRQIADSIRLELTKLNKDIVYVSLMNIEDSMGEIVAKAFTIALFQLMCNMVIVVYQCTSNIKKNIFDTMRVFYQHADIEGMFYGRNIQVIMYSMDYEEVVLDLSSAKTTDSINAYLAHMKCIALPDGYLNSDLCGVDLDRGAAKYIPCDVLHRVKIDGKIQTLFEHYAESILKNNIQKHEFGCQLEHSHMRLGSTIHIDKFYEAEILFGNKLFVSRFALLLVNDMEENIRNISKLTLYGYGTYSETVLVQMIEMIHSLFSDKIDVDYIILEREEERRGFQHKDRIRYNKYFVSKQDRINYFKDRKIAIVVLINSTLKTHMRLINLFKEENDISISNCDWLIKNYAVLLVGNTNTNGYWKLENNNVIMLKEPISPTPIYFVQVNANYQEPLECLQCFPTNPVAELPLIEVNAASTIPNQAFGIVENSPIKSLQLDYEFIKTEEKKVGYLKREFTYGHVHRNENHFLYYFKTENICIKQKDEIKASLKKWIECQSLEEGLQFNIIVSPMHFSNAGFVELVNNVVFGGNAILLRVDFDKEYRCNAYAKYSYLRNYVEQLCFMGSVGTVCVHYVDDAIISGRTFHRAKSLMHTILNLNSSDSTPIKIKIFNKVFVLVDRNSAESRNQYVFDEKTDFYAFVKVNISSLRNYGDSCVYCNLKKEADLLSDTASTKLIADYWKDCTKKFQLYSLEEYNEFNQCPDYDKQFRRLFCTHMAQCVLKEEYHGNENSQAIYLILKLLNVDYESREEDKFEYFLSYLKCISRPFLVFKKAIKEAIFDIMLILIDAIICDKTLREIIKEIELDKPYLKENKIIRQFNRLDKKILQSPDLSDDNKKDLVRLLMKQLTELKSNYIIRPVKMDAIFAFMGDENKEKFEQDYLKLIDRLVGASSDTNKSVWLDDKIMGDRFEHVSENFRIWVLLENTRTFRDGIEKLYKRIYKDNSTTKEFSKIVNNRISELEVQYDYKRACKMFEDFEKKYRVELQNNLSTDNSNSEMVYKMNNKIERFLKNLPKLETVDVIASIDSTRYSKDSWYDIFYYLKGVIEEEFEERKNNQEIDTQSELLKWINTEFDIYQFNNFYRLLQKEEYFKDSKLSVDGADMIACCIKVLDICRNEKMDILEKVQLLAILFKIILDAYKVQFIIENKTERNLDEWKYEIEKRYNAIIDNIRNVDKTAELEKIHIKQKRHYSVIVEKAGSEDYNTEVTDEVETLINELECKSPKQHNYLIDTTHGIVLWKLENNQRSIWINIENHEWCTNEPTYRFKIAKAIRKIMMFYQELINKIFNPQNDDFINEISHARKELSIYNSNKVHTHTQDYSKEMLFEQAQNYFQDKHMDCMEQYPSYVLKLLADINISKYYRYGLRVNLYYDDRGIENAASWKEFSKLIKDGQEFIYPISETETVNIHLQVEDIDVEEKVLCMSSPSSVREILMLIYALILNAAEQNRGKRQIEKTDIQIVQKSVIVKVYKENGYLVIENECESAVNIEQIRRKLQYIPDSEEDGISLWSFNCYIRRCISSLILAKLKEIERGLVKNQNEIEDVKQTGAWINKLMGQDYEIQPIQNVSETGVYIFKVMLPIFMEKYQCGEKGKENGYE